jgi:hypothetical protein
LSANSLSPPIVQVVTTVDEGCDDEQQSLAKYITLKPPSAIRRLISTCRPLSNINLWPIALSLAIDDEANKKEEMEDKILHKEFETLLSHPCRNQN